MHPKLGAAILVGLAVVTALYLIYEKAPTVYPLGNNPIPPTTSSASTSSTSPSSVASPSPSTSIGSH